MRQPTHPLGCPHDCYQHRLVNTEGHLAPVRAYKREDGTILPCPIHGLSPKEQQDDLIKAAKMLSLAFPPKKGAK